MSSHDFDRRYRLLTVVARADGVRTHDAQEVTTGRSVMVHVVEDASPAFVDALSRSVTRLADAERARVLETATLPTGYAVVTEYLGGLHSFPAWVAERAGDDANAASGTAPRDATAITAESPTADTLDLDADADPPQAVEFTVGGDGASGGFTRLYLSGGRLNLETSPAHLPFAEAFPLPGLPAPSGAASDATGVFAARPAGAARSAPASAARRRAPRTSRQTPPTRRDDSPAPRPALAAANPKPPIPFAVVAAINLVVLLALGLGLYVVLRPKAPAAAHATTAVPNAPAPAAPAAAAPTSATQTTDAAAATALRTSR